MQEHELVRIAYKKFKANLYFDIPSLFSDTPEHHHEAEASHSQSIL